MKQIELRQITHARSGEKGNDSNVAVFAYDAADYPLLCEQLTVDVIRGTYGLLLQGDVERYEAPNVSGLNFLLHGALGGGRSRTLAFDESGKELSSLVLGHRLTVPDDYRSRPRPA